MSHGFNIGEARTRRGIAKRESACLASCKVPGYGGGSPPTPVHSLPGGALAQSSPVRALDFTVRDLLRWLYVGRLTLTLGVWAAILVVDPVETLDPTRLATLMFFGSLIFTGLSFWYTHVLGREPGHNFLYLHVLFDVALVTAIVHILEDTTFVPAYILVITEGALLLPLPGGVLIGALAALAYFGDQVLFFSQSLSLAYTSRSGSSRPWRSSPDGWGTG